MTEQTGNAHKDTGTNWGEKGASTYAATRHGPDGAKFLDPFFTSHLRNLNGHRIIDIGCGAGPWSVYASDHGARQVVAIDYQWPMVGKAKSEVLKAEVSSTVNLAQADGAALPTIGAVFSLAMSINVGCNLPKQSFLDNKFPSEDPQQREVGFNAHFTEMARVLEYGGRAVVTAPTSYGEIFTSGNKPKNKVLAEIQERLHAIGESNDPEVIKTELNKLDDVYRATFHWVNNRLTLVTNEDDLKSGEETWRKLPSLAVPNYYHNENEYVQSAKAAGLELVKEYHAMFENEEERAAYNLSVGKNKQLGHEYVMGVGKPPFAVFVFQKIA